ncbi:MAG: hypothetical protein ABI462_12055 [Ignavibacteria bacterium]
MKFYTSQFFTANLEEIVYVETITSEEKLHIGFKNGAELVIDYAEDGSEGVLIEEYEKLMSALREMK